MAMLPTDEHTTLYAIDQRIKENAVSGFRPHLGGSMIGQECWRVLWYNFRWYTPAHFEPRILRLFHRGHREEEVFVSLLNSVGVKTYGFQNTVSAFGGHFGGSIDGIGEGLAESGKPHLLEFKTHGDKSFKELIKLGLQKAKPVHYAQMQIYMYLSKLKRGYYMAVNKNDDSLYAIRIKLDTAFAKELLEKAGNIIFDRNPPSRVSNLASNWVCRWCDHKDTCHYGDKPAMNCRTCSKSAPQEDGTWYCADKQSTLTLDDQKEGCHKYTLPVFIK